jgi:hypothetical protein
MDRQTLRDWVHHYNEDGIDGLSNRRSPGRPAQLTVEQLEAFKALVEQGPPMNVTLRQTSAPGGIHDEPGFGRDGHRLSTGRYRREGGWANGKRLRRDPKRNAVFAPFQKPRLSFWVEGACHALRGSHP